MMTKAERDFHRSFGTLAPFNEMTPDEQRAQIADALDETDAALSTLPRKLLALEGSCDPAKLERVREGLTRLRIDFVLMRLRLEKQLGPLEGLSQ